ncbi:MAG TPA: AsmA-like C-terminal region-containing protein [Candidatus Obscuribacterales bacterium]
MITLINKNRNAQTDGQGFQWRNTRFRHLVFRFLLGWIASLFVIILLALSWNADWCRPQCESALSEMFHRRIELGHISWNLGLGGLAISTRYIKAHDKDGRPFLLSKRSGIGIAFSPLLKGEFVINYLDFQSPEIWAVREASGHWNFEDLLKQGPDIRIIQLNKGRLHIVDETRKDVSGEPKLLTFDDIKLKFVWPKKKRSKPFLLAFKLDRPQYASRIQLSGLGVGALEDWRKNKYKFTVTGSRVNPRDVEELSECIFPPSGKSQPQQAKFEGLFDFSLKGEGALDTGLNATAEINADQFAVSEPNFGKIVSPKASSEGMFVIDNEKIAWKEMSLRLNNVTVKSQGHLNRWHEKEREYSARFLGKLDDLKVLAGIFGAQSARKKGKHDEFMKASFANAGREHLSGKAEFTIDIARRFKRTEIESKFKAGGVALADLIEETDSGFKKVLVALGISDDLSIEGDVKLVPGERIDIRQGEVEFAFGKLKIAGGTDWKENTSQYLISADSISLSGIERNISRSIDAQREMARLLNLPAKSKVALSGKASLKARLEKRNFASSYDTTVGLTNASLTIDQHLALRNLNGTIERTNNETSFDRLSGSIGNGTFSLDGKISSRAKDAYDLEFQGSDIDLGEVAKALEIFGQDMPLIREHALSGKMKEVVLRIEGNRQHPRVILTASPSDLYYQPDGLSRPIRASSGAIVYKNDQLVLKDMVLALKASSITANITLDQLSTAAKLTSARFKTQAAELAEVLFFLNSPLMPAPARKQFASAMSRYGVTDAHGRVYGDVSLDLVGNQARFDGVIGLMNVSAKVGRHSIPLAHLNGVLAATGKELLLQDLSGTINESKIALDGYIYDYATANAHWNADIRGLLQSRELTDMLHSSRVGTSKVAFLSQGPVELKAKVSGSNESNNITFLLKADKEDQITLCGPFGSLHQPAGDSLSLDGSLTATGDNVVIKDAHLFLGESLLNTCGTISKLDGAKEGETAINLSVRSPNPLPARKFLSSLTPGLADKNASGFVDLSLSVVGEMENPKFNGYVMFDRVCIPKLNLYDATGTVSSREAFDPRSRRNPFHFKLDLRTVRLGYLMVREMTGDLSLKPVDGRLKTPKVTLKNAEALIADGKMQLNGWVEADEHKVGLKANFRGVKAAEIGAWLFGHPGEISGMANASVDLQTEGVDAKEMIANLSGQGSIAIQNGTLARFSHLQEKLTQANLLHQGVLGFNLNNLLQTMVPVRTGNFKDLSGHFQISQGQLSIRELRYNGDDMRLWGAGSTDLTKGIINLEIAGNIPRVQSSLLGGPIGKVSKRITVQKFLSTITFRKLEQLPPLPLLGDIASDRPRAFTFKIASPLEQPKLVAQSIEKSFKWLPTKPLASAHPVPGI